MATRVPTDNIMIDVIAEKINRSENPEIMFDNVVETLKRKVGINLEKDLTNTLPENDMDLTDEEEEID